MKYIKVDEIPKIRGSKNDLQCLIKEFMSDEKIDKAKVEIKKGEYSKIEYAYKSLYNAIKVSGENCRCIKRGNDIFLVKMI